MLIIGLRWSIGSPTGAGASLPVFLAGALHSCSYYDGATTVPGRVASGPARRPTAPEALPVPVAASVAAAEAKKVPRRMSDTLRRAPRRKRRMKPAYVVVTPARDEERTIAATIESMLRQTVRPLRWVIVNDGSTDRTRALVEKHLAAHPWIELIERADRGFRALGGGVVDAFNEGFARVAGLPWDFVVKFDADLSFDARYFEDLLERFEADPKLGMASGKTFLVENGAQVDRVVPRRSRARSSRRCTGAPASRRSAGSRRGAAGT